MLLHVTSHEAIRSQVDVSPSVFRETSMQLLRNHSYSCPKLVKIQGTELFERPQYSRALALVLPWCCCAAAESLFSAIHQILTLTCGPRHSCLTPHIFVYILQGGARNREPCYQLWHLSSHVMTCLEASYQTKLILQLATVPSATAQVVEMDRRSLQFYFLLTALA